MIHHPRNLRQVEFLQTHAQADKYALGRSSRNELSRTFSSKKVQKSPATVRGSRYRALCLVFNDITRLINAVATVYERNEAIQKAYLFLEYTQNKIESVSLKENKASSSVGTSLVASFL